MLIYKKNWWEPSVVDLIRHAASNHKSRYFSIGTKKDRKLTCSLKQQLFVFTHCLGSVILAHHFCFICLYIMIDPVSVRVSRFFFRIMTRSWSWISHSDHWKLSPFLVKQTIFRNKLHFWLKSLFNCQKILWLEKKFCRMK